MIHTIRQSSRVGFAVAMALAAVLPAWAQRGGRVRSENLLQQQRLIDDKLSQQREEQAPFDSLLDWEWGGWLEYYIFDFNDGIQSQRVLQRPGLAFWTRLRADDGAHELFARVKINFEYFNPGDEFRRQRQQDWIGPNLERGWYQIDVGRAFRLTEPADPVQFRVRIGRQEVYFGTGYVLDIPLDAVVADLNLGEFRLTGLYGRTSDSYPNIDRSTAVANHSARKFFGVQLAYDGIDDFQPFAYALWNDDDPSERPNILRQKFAYDTRYFGIGARGSIMHQLNYRAEWVYENGQSYGDGNFRRSDNVDAWAWDMAIEKLWDHPSRPRAELEYMFASGDPDRRLSPTNARGGNRGDRADTSFVGFGYRDTGLSAAPILSNIHVFKAGGSFVPLHDRDLFRDLEVGANWFLYQKHHRGAAISDPTADRRSGYVGWEMDTFVNWRLASDVSWTMRWGLFFPGKSYSDRGTRSFLFTGVTWSF